MHNARIVQALHGRFLLLWNDDAGAEVEGGIFGTPDEAATELAKLQAEAAAAETKADAP